MAKNTRVKFRIPISQDHLHEPMTVGDALKEAGYAADPEQGQLLQLVTWQDGQVSMDPVELDHVIVDTDVTIICIQLSEIDLENIAAIKANHPAEEQPAAPEPAQAAPVGESEAAEDDPGQANAETGTETEEPETGAEGEKGAAAAVETATPDPSTTAEAGTEGAETPAAGGQAAEPEKAAEATP